MMPDLQRQAMADPHRARPVQTSSVSLRSRDCSDLTEGTPARFEGAGTPEAGREQDHPWRIDRFDFITLLVFSGLSLWLLIWLASESRPNRIWTGTDGPFIGDQMQYLGWINDAAHHLLIGNPFQSIGTTGYYLHPGLAISGGLVRLGLSSSAAYLVWKPVAVIVLFAAVRFYVRRLVLGIAARRAALVLALFYLSPLSLLSDANWLSVGDRLALQAIGTEMWPGLYLWGYPFTALSVAAIPLVLLAYGRDRETGRIRPWAPLGGLICAWLQPWQGATLLAALFVSEMFLWHRHRRFLPDLLVVTCGATAAPLAYYSLLSRFDPTWALSGHVNLVTFPWLPLVVIMAPLSIFGVLAYLQPSVDFQDVALRMWPIVAIFIYALISISHVGTFPLHSLQGLSIPVAVLAVTGARRLRTGRLSRSMRVLRPALAIVAVGVMILPAGVHELDSATALGNPVFGAQQPFFITASEQEALGDLRHNPLPGSVLAPVYLGQTIPAETGRQTWVGIRSWTPHFDRRTVLAGELFSGTLDRTAARGLVRSSDARFLLSDCAHRIDLRGLLGPALATVRNVGCATLYTVRPGW